MSKTVITERMVEAAVWGGATLGGGGGGAMKDGLETGLLAVRMGEVVLRDIDTMKPQDTLLTVSAVGAPAAKERYVRPADFVRAVTLFKERFGTVPAGIITNECGGNATINGWLQSATLGLPLIDAPCNGRAHPTGIMGSMGLTPSYVSQQTAVGGNPSTGKYLEVAVSANLETAAGMVRQASVQAGGLVAVARNPVTAEYARANAAPGAIAQSIGLGEAMLAANEKGTSAAFAAAEFLQGEILLNGKVSSVSLVTKGGFDVGIVLVDGAQGRVELTFWNEYMTAEIDGQRLATFPDLIATLSAKDGKPLSTADIVVGQDVAILVASREKLILGAGMRDKSLFTVAEQAVEREIISYVFTD